MSTMPEDTPFVAYNKVDGKVPTLVGNWVEVRHHKLSTRSRSQPFHFAACPSSAILHLSRKGRWRREQEFIA